MCSCPICYEEIPNSQKHITSCGHIFHKHCISLWLNTKKSCPMCRNDIQIKNMIYYIQELVNKDYKFDSLVCVRNNAFKINNLIFKKPYLELLNQTPQAWIDCSEFNNFAPIYSITSITGEKIFVDYYLRQIILFDMIKPEEIEIRESIENKFYTTTQKIFNYKSRKTYEVMVDWIYEIMKKFISPKFNVKYLNSMNSLLLDIVTLTIQKFNTIDDIQSIILGSVFCVNKLFNNLELKNKDFKWLSNNKCEEEKIIKYIEFQEKIIKRVIKI
jgi:hypothetical protein